MKKTAAALTATTLLLVLAGCGGQPSAAPASAPAPAPAPTPAPAGKAKPELKAQVLTCAAPGGGLDSQVDLDGAVYGAVKTGDVAVAVTKVQVAAEVGKHTAQGQFVIITLGMQNHGNEKATLGLVSDHVVISEGKRYSADGFVGLSYSEMVGEKTPLSLNPDLSAVDTYVFDMPKSHDPCKAQLEITRRPERQPKVTYMVPVGVAKQ